MFTIQLNKKIQVSLIVLACLLVSLNVFSQTLLTNTTVTGTPAAGSYYSTTKININPTFTYSAASGGTLKYYIASPDCVPLATAPGTAQNYIMTSVPRVPGYNPAGTGYSACDVMQTIQYFDGLGRPLQTVQVQGSPSNKDLVQPVAYDAYGREAIKYQPYAATTSNGSFKTDALTPGAGVANFYYPSGTTAQSGTQQGNGIVLNTAPYAQTIFEPSPLNRVTEQGAPGVPWQPNGTSPSSAHTVRMVYTTNNITAMTDTANCTLVSLYTVTINTTDQSRAMVRGTGAAANYGAGQLYMTVSRNENLPATGRGGTVEEYKDKEGHVVLKRTFNWVPAIGSTPATLQMLSTYYIYDDMGNLAFVLPPMAGGDSGTGTPAQTTLDNLCYQYRYDERSRLSQKKLPGKGWEYTVYNQLDQPVLSQDANQRGNNQWTVTKYDGQGRVIITGLWNAGSVITQASLQSSIYAGAQWDVRDNTNNTAANPTGYVVSSYPALTTALTISYYDDYNFAALPTQYSAPAGYSIQTSGLPTATKTNILGTSNMLWSVIYYDGLGRVIQIYKQHNQGGGATLNAVNYDVVAMTYDFTNVVLTTNRKHYNAAISTTAPAVTIANTYSYDHMGRKTQTFEQINGGTNVLLSKLTYNEIGQLWTKSLHSANGSTNFLQPVTYTYNERGWLLSANASLFSEQLQYNTGTNKQYNGNIAYQLYQSAATPCNYHLYLFVRSAEPPYKRYVKRQL